MHYHGTPITPRAQLERMAGRCFCVSFAAPQDLATCLRIGQSVMLDNGAFSTFTRGEPFDEAGFYDWIRPVLAPPHWAVVPDVIDGTMAQQREMVARWPYRRDLGAPVFHLGLPLEYLLELTAEWPRVYLGSSGEYWEVGSAKWAARMDEVFNALARWQVKPPRHLMERVVPLILAPEWAGTHPEPPATRCGAELIDDLLTLLRRPSPIGHEAR